MSQSKQDYPDLRIVPVGRIIPHELHDEQRATPLVHQLREDKVLRSPVLVTEIIDDFQDPLFVVLDGTNRSIALDMLGVGHALVQVVPYEEPHVELRTWNHAISSIDAAQLGRLLVNLPGLQVEKTSNDVTSGAVSTNIVASCELVSDETYVITGEEVDLESRSQYLQAVVACYIQIAKVDRITSDRVETIHSMFPELAGVITFPQFIPDDIIALIKHGWRVPAGITRHLIRGRALRVNYPLTTLASAKTTDEKNEELLSWMRGKFANRQVRYYAEPTYLFDE